MPEFPAAEDRLIEGAGLTKTYLRASRPALAGVTLQVNAGEIVGVIGPNGSGKTTLMSCLLGLLKPDDGVARIGGHPSGSPQANRFVGYVPERLNFDPWMKGRDFVAYHHALAGLPATERAAQVERALAEAGLGVDAWDRPIKGYSRGMLQRVGLAQALVGKPRCLFLDEPTSGMDPQGALATRARIEAFAAAGGAVLVNSHQLDQLGKLCHRVLFLKDGRLEAEERLRGETGLGWHFDWLTPLPSGAKAKALLEELVAGGAVLEPGGLRAQVADEEAAAELLASLIKAGIRVNAAGPARGNLEHLFLGGAHVE
jgi:ABC-2 type transport system ATP-binding protein